MAIYHFSVKMISRAAGRSAVAAAAYRAASRLPDERLGRHHDFTGKAGVVHSEILLPGGAPERLRDRSALWNEVEAVEARKDAQLAREIEFAIPREMSKAQGIALARDFVAREFVARGMVADLNVHWDIGVDGEPKPHAHVMLATREVGEEGFGAKCRDWNATALLQHWRQAWAAHVNARCADLGIEARIDHRSHEALGLDLEPQHKIGAACARRDARGQEAERAAEHRTIARQNGATILGDPAIGLAALTRTQATFTVRDLAMFAHRHSDGQAQFDAVFAAMRHHGSVLALGRDGRGQDRLTTASMLQAEHALAQAGTKLDGARHPVRKAAVRHAVAQAAANGLELGAEQRHALSHVTSRRGLSLVVGYAGTGKSAMLGVARLAWENAGLRVRGAALSGIAAENLEAGSGIASRTLASLEHSWANGRDRLSRNDVLVIDEAGMIGTRQLQRVLVAAADAEAKVVLVGDVQQLQAIEAGAAFRLLVERHGAAELGDVRRQAVGWMRDATRQLATGGTGEALGAYAANGMAHPAATRAAARSELIRRWAADSRAQPAPSRIILTHLKTEVAMLNEAARMQRRDAGELGPDITVRTEQGERQFADSDRILFLRNERDLGVRNGTLGTVEQAAPDRLAVRLDDGRRVTFDLKTYAHVEHGYAATIHKAQGLTVNRTYVLATPGMDAHSTYVALSRHRLGTSLHFGRDDFADQAALQRTLSRERPKDMALDYGTAERHAGSDSPSRGSAAHSQRAQDLRAMVKARVQSMGRDAEAMRAGLAKAAQRVRGPGRGRDRGAER